MNDQDLCSINYESRAWTKTRLEKRSLDPGTRTHVCELVADIVQELLLETRLVCVRIAFMAELLLLTIAFCADGVYTRNWVPYAVAKLVVVLWLSDVRVPLIGFGRLPAGADFVPPLERLHSREVLPRRLEKFGLLSSHVKQSGPRVERSHSSRH